MELSLSAQKHDVSDSDMNYAMLRANFTKLAVGAKRQFSETYLPSIASLDELVLGWSAYCKTIVDQSVESALDFLAEHGIYDISKPAFLSFLRKYDHSEVAVLQLAKYVEALELERSEREAGRLDGQSPGFIGGGFGLEGAAKGIAIASAANLAVSAVKGLGNAVASANSAREANLRKNSMLFSDHTRDSLSTTIYELVFSTHYATIDVIASAPSISGDFSRPSQDVTERAEALLESCKKARVPEESQQKLLAAALFRSPYTEGIYEFWLGQFGDANGELAKFYETYHLVPIEPLKEHVLGQKLPVPEEVANADECDKATQQLDDACSSLDLSRDNEYAKKLRGRFESRRQALVALTSAKRSLDQATGTAIEIKDDLITVYEGSPSLKNRVGLVEGIDAYFDYLQFLLEALVRLDWRFLLRGMAVDYDLAIDDTLNVVLASVSSLGCKLNTSACSYYDTGASSPAGVIQVVTSKPKKAILTIEHIPNGKTRVRVKVSWWQGKGWEAVVHGRMKRVITAHD